MQALSQHFLQPNIHEISACQERLREIYSMRANLEIHSFADANSIIFSKILYPLFVSFGNF
jgi:hypothetical protein